MKKFIYIAVFNDDKQFFTTKLKDIYNYYNKYCIKNHMKSLGERAFSNNFKLNNMTDLFINDIEVDIVNSNETLARNLTGKTIVCFHIRDAK